MIKSVIFDLGGVYFTDETNGAVKRISKGYNLDSEEVSDFFGTKSKPGKLYPQGKITSKYFWGEFKRKFKLKVNEEKLTKLWISCYKPNKGVINLIKKLRKKRIKLYFLSDNVKERSNILQDKYKFLENFDDGIFSHKMGITKSEGNKVFKIILKITKDKPKEAIFIDDKEVYVGTAKTLGMKSIHFKNARQLEKEINYLLD